MFLRREFCRGYIGIYESKDVSSAVKIVILLIFLSNCINITILVHWILYEIYVFLENVQL